MNLLVTASMMAVALTAAPLHEDGVIHLGAGEVPAGTTVEVRGEKLPESEDLRLELRGALATFALDTVRTDSLGVFRLRVALPAAADAGSYTIVAIAPDGDVVASEELALLPRVVVEETVASSEGAGAAGGGDAAGGGGHDATAAPTDAPRQATAAMMDLPVRTSAGEWAVVLGFIALALAGAWVGLARRVSV